VLNILINLQHSSVTILAANISAASAQQMLPMPTAESHAKKSKTMTIDFVGDWCFASQDRNVSWYQLPSWVEGGHCTKILSINPYGFYGEGKHCEPVNDMQLTKDTAPSGGYTAMVTARCQPDGPVTTGKLQVFKFYRYKGSLSVEVLR
jgi:hypothetical protein